MIAVHADDVIPFLQLAGQRDDVGENKYDIGLLTATGAVASQHKEQDRPSTQLSKVIQLTGFSDPVYAEAYVNVNQYDIVLDVLIVNQTPDTLQGLALELATLGKSSLLPSSFFAPLFASPLTLSPFPLPFLFLTFFVPPSSLPLFLPPFLPSSLLSLVPLSLFPSFPCFLSFPSLSLSTPPLPSPPYFTGDLKLVEKPTPCTVGPHDFVNIKVGLPHESHVIVT